VAFLRELGMRDPVAASSRSTGDATAAVGIHPRAGEGGRLLDTPTTLVQLRRYSGGWVVTAATASNVIEVDEPLAFTRVRSPLTVSGLSSAVEGTVHVAVAEDRRGADRVLGTGFVHGGAAELAPFRGPISFQRPSADAGWVVFSGDTGADTAIRSATAVRIRFATATAVAPRIVGVRTTPAPSAAAELVTLTGSGTFGVRVGATGAQEVRFLLVPSGTGGRPHARLLGVDTQGGDGWSLAWRYPNQATHGHLLVQVNGRGGTVEHEGIAVLHT
jgi:Immunoglobulin-like domain of bacterial spore germination